MTRLNIHTKGMKGLVLFIGILICKVLNAQQDTSQLVRYTPDFKFKDGIFTSFDQVKQNDPIPKSLIISPVIYDDPDFYERILGNRQIQYFDNLGTSQVMPVENIWGYSNNGILHININDGFYRVNVIGSICHFIASLTSYNNPYYPYASPYYYPYSPYYPPPYTNYQATEMRQYLLDFKTGKVMDYDVPEIEVLLMTDPELHDEYTSLSRRKKKQQKFFYIRQFNERNPLYFPKN